MKKFVNILLIMAILITSIPIKNLPNEVRAAAGDLFVWNKNDTLDASLNIVENKTGHDDILFELDVEEVGSYELNYFLEDSRKTIVEFEQEYDRLKIAYRVENQDGDSITQELIDRSYLEMNYASEVVDWEYIDDKTVTTSSGAIEFTIPRSASNQYPGIAFEIDNKRVIMRWDFQTGDVYYLITGYNSGNVMPVEFTNTVNTTQTINILKGLEDFTVTPTHLEPDGGDNQDLGLITHPSDNTPGKRPGIKLSFKQPKEWDEVNWEYSSENSDFEDLKAIIGIDDIASEEYLDFSFFLNNDEDSGDKSIDSLPENNDSGVVYSYDAGTDTYTIDIVQDKSDLNHQDQIIQWDALEASTIYNVNIGFEKTIEALRSDYEFKEYTPVNNFAYTYMAYELKRANMQEAYLDVKPYDVSTNEEVEYTILYSKVITTELDPNNDLWVKHYHSSGNSDDNIYIPVPFRGDSSQDVYQIIVNFAGIDLESQVLNYIAQNDGNIPPTTPRIDSLENLYIVPPEDLDEDSEEDVLPSKIQFDLIWTAPENKDIKELETLLEDENNRIYYEVMVNELPTDTEENPFETIKVFEVYKEDDVYKVKDYYDQATPSSILNYSNGYDSIKELFRMEEITILENGEWVKVIDTEIDEDANTYTIPTQEELDTEYDFEYPGVNYIRIKAITAVNGAIGESYNSIPISLSLSMLEIDVPIPDNLSYTPITGVEQEDPIGIDLSWSSVAVDNYENHMIDPLGKQVNHVEYEIYLSQDRDKMVALDPTNSELMDTYTQFPIDSDNRNITINDEALNLLRDGEVIYYGRVTSKDLDSSLASRMEGLDENSNYYIRIVTNLEVEDISDETIVHKRSKPSVLLSATTPVRPEEPGEGEVKPLSVENFEVTFLEEDMLQGKLSWDFPEEVVFQEDEYGFEVFAIEDQSLTEDLQSTQLSITELFSAEEIENADKEAWRIFIEDGVTVLKQYDVDNDEWVEQSSNLLSIGTQSVEMIDSSNDPNKVYYYYVRTVDIYGGIPTAASAWQIDSLTTSPIQGPINLTVVYDSDYNYDDQTESIIRFDAPIPLGSISANEYVMEIYVKGDEDSDYSRTKYPAEYLGENEDGSLGYTRVFYRITDLEPGKSYSIKVRIEDRTKDQEEQPDESMSYPKSTFSERILIRTEFDQESYDKEIIYGDYLDYYDKKIEEMKINSYFQVYESSSLNTIKYRDAYGIGAIQVEKNGTFSLQGGNSNTQVIYLPADFVEELNTQKTSLEIALREHTILIRPRSIGANYTDEIQDMIDEINDPDSDLVDYFVKIEVDVDQYDDEIENEEPVSDVLDIDIDILGSEISEEDLELEILDELDSIASSERMSLSNEIENELENGIDEEELLEIVQEALEDVQEDHMDAIDDLMDKYFEETDNVKQLAKEMQIRIRPYENGTGAKAYIEDGSDWETLDSYFYNQSYILESVLLSSYVLLPWGASPSELGRLYSPEEIELINKYNLSEIFSADQLTNPSQGFYQYRLIEVLAKILGKHSNDYNQNKDYLRNLGIQVPVTIKTTVMSKEQVYAICTQAYSIKQKISLDSVRIRNYYIIENLSEADETLRNTLLIGANMGVFKVEDGWIDFKSDLPIKEAIDILTKVDQGIKW